MSAKIKTKRTSGCVNRSKTFTASSNSTSEMPSARLLAAAATRCGLNLEEHRFLRALHMDIEGIDRLPIRDVALRDQGVAAVRGYQRKDWIPCVRRLIGKIDPRIALAQHATRKDREHDMGRLHLAIGTGNRARLDGVE